MSLDVYLTTPTPQKRGGSGIFVRQSGQTVEITREEWESRFPGREPVVYTREEESPEVFSANITHNLNTMADEAGIYKALWRPDENGITKAAQLIEPLEAGLALMKSDPDRFIKLNPKNGWGSYKDFLPWVERYIHACREYPDAEVRVSR